MGVKPIKSLTKKSMEYVAKKSRACTDSLDKDFRRIAGVIISELGESYTTWRDRMDAVNAYYTCKLDYTRTKNELEILCEGCAIHGDSENTTESIKQEKSAE